MGAAAGAAGVVAVAGQSHTAFADAPQVCLVQRLLAPLISILHLLFRVAIAR